jgi:hypothetical protein
MYGSTTLSALATLGDYSPGPIMFTVNFGPHIGFGRMENRIAFGRAVSENRPRASSRQSIDSDMPFAAA